MATGPHREDHGQPVQRYTVASINDIGKSPLLARRIVAYYTLCKGGSTGRVLSILFLTPVLSQCCGSCSEHFKYTKDDLLIAIPGQTERLPLIEASRSWRQGVATFVALEKPLKEKDVPEGFLVGELQPATACLIQICCTGTTPFAANLAEYGQGWRRQRLPTCRKRPSRPMSIMAPMLTLVPRTSGKRREILGMNPWVTPCHCA